MVSTAVLRVDPRIISVVSAESGSSDDADLLSDWYLKLEPSEDAAHLERAARELRDTAIPVAFPTETVYGLGADATRSDAVQGIYKAKQRPADNPLIVHVHSLDQLRHLLRPRKHHSNDSAEPVSLNGTAPKDDPIPAIYHPLIQRFWPGPLTLIMPNPPNSSLATEVTAGLSTFGVRMPSNKLALALIKLANLPIAAPSANSSSKPSPTTAEHVRNDLEGRISTIIDGGPCTVGVESTVVNGLSDPPLVLRPGGIGLDDLRKCTGWENVQIGYKDLHQADDKPLAPGMKYRHYSPKATVILYEAGKPQPSTEEMFSRGQIIGVIRTKTWKSMCPQGTGPTGPAVGKDVYADGPANICANGTLPDPLHQDVAKAVKFSIAVDEAGKTIDVWEIDLGSSIAAIARGLFSALRGLDLKSVDAIFVEGVNVDQGDIAAAVMNRLRKAAEA